MLLKYLLERAREPSTWAGLGPLLTAAGWQISPDMWASISMACMGTCGIIAMSLRERK
jgi:hypothetical protein